MDDDALDGDCSFEKFRRDWQRMSGLPVGSDARRNAERKKTAASKRAAKRVGKQTGGLRKRRNKRID
jgi:hypothetical protein